MPRAYVENHVVGRIGWLRAAVLGVASASQLSGNAILAGVPGLVAGAMAIAAGMYASVRSQSDSEPEDIARECTKLAADPGCEVQELTVGQGRNAHQSRRFGYSGS
ncbi:MAG: VIT1/CCC1 transporter family protein [Mesorhizobium sp.]